MYVYCVSFIVFFFFFFFKQKTAYEMRISDWSSDVCSSDLLAQAMRLSLLTRVMQLELTEELRERLGETYSPGAGADLSDEFPGYGWLQIGRASCRERVCQYV